MRLTATSAPLTPATPRLKKRSFGVSIIKSKIQNSGN